MEGIRSPPGTRSHRPAGRGRWPADESTASHTRGWRRVFGALLEALAGLARLPLEPGTPEIADALLARRWTTELEGELLTRLLRTTTVDPGE